MITIATDDINDIYVDASGNIAISQDIVALANVSKNRVLTNLGEPQFNIDFGIPYFQTIFTDTPKIDLFQAAVIQILEEQEGINRVSKFNYTQDNGIFAYSLTEHTIYGDIELNG